jgi:hypothetical protein
MAAKKKAVTMSKPKPVLRCETETIHKVDVYDLETFIQAVTGHTYECVANQEWSNDSQHRFSVDGKMLDYEVEVWEKFKRTGVEESYILRNILEGLVMDGHVPSGTYLITVSW